MKYNRAFSLVELLISLIIISLIVAAFAPIMTKKLTRGGVLGAETSNNMIDELLLTKGNSYKEGLYECLQSEDESLTNCNFYVPNNVSEISAVLVGGGGGGAGGVSANIEQAMLVTNKTELTQTLTIENGMDNFIITDLIGAGGGGGAGYNKKGYQKRYIKECPEKTETVYTYKGGEYCITKYNLRPSNYTTETPASPYEIKVDTDKVVFLKDTIGTKPGDEIPLPTCMNQGIVKNSTCTLENEYPGCGRAICTWQAANILCSELSLGENTCSNGGDGEEFALSCIGKWRLGQNGEMEKYYSINDPDGVFYANYAGLGDNKVKNSLRLCNENIYFLHKGTPSCGEGYGSGYPRYGNIANAIWGGSYGTGKARYLINSQHNELIGNPGQSVDIGANFMSVRCVLRAAEPQQCTSFSGGGASSGTSITGSIKIPDEIIQNNIGAQIILKAGHGGKGGTKDSTLEAEADNETQEVSDGLLGTDGANGEYSEVTVQKENNILWGYRVAGGIGGKRATENSSGASTNYSIKCESYDISTSSWKNVSCSGATAKPGYSGSQWTSCAGIQGGSGGSLGTSEKYGNGGRGGYGIPKGKDETQKNYGEDGYNGYAKVTYTKINSKGAAGGGGSGACASRIEKISVKRGDMLNIVVGSGGKGGNIEVRGSNGNRSSIALGDRFRYTMEGGIGGKTGIPGRKEGDSIIEPINGLESEETICDVSSVSDTSDTLGDILSESDRNNIVFKHRGSIGTGAKVDEVTGNAMGGVGGLSGFSKLSSYTYTYGGCGGYFNEICLNNDRNGLSSASYLPSKLFATENYGTLGAGGGGGGWMYDLADPKPAGVGGDGLDGFVYLYWKKVK